MARVTLSFDNGPTAETTPHVLDVLAHHGVRASFFVIGEKLSDPVVRRQAERAKAEGHRIGNHTWSHLTPLGEIADADAPEREIGRTQALIGDLASAERWFRPFGGGGKLGPHLLSPAAVRFLTEGAYSCVLWNAIPGDWKDPEGWVDTALEQCAALPHALVVLHDHVPEAMRRLDRFLGRALDAGHTFAQDFPDDCVPLFRGRVRAPMSPFVADAEA